MKCVCVCVCARACSPSLLGAHPQPPPSPGTCSSNHFQALLGLHFGARSTSLIGLALAFLLRGTG